MIKLPEANVAVLIDYENVGLDAIEYLLDQLSDVGRVIIKRAYGDWSVQRGQQNRLLELGIEAIHQYHSNKSGKNSSDIRLAIDAIDLLYVSPIDTFVIVSSDSDFVPLVGKLRSSGKSVIGSGRKDATSSTLIRSCDRYIFLDPAKPAAAAAASQSRNRRRTTRSPVREDYFSVLTRAMEVSMDDQGTVVGSKLYQTMCRIDPAFDLKAIGFRNFKQFLESYKEIKIVPPQNGGDVIVQLNQPNEQSAPPIETENREENRPPPRPPVRREPVRPPVDNGYRSQPSPVVEEDKQPPFVEVPSVAAPSGYVDETQWEHDIDILWSNRQRKRITGPVAASDAAKVLGVTKLSVSKYPSIDKLLVASDVLRAKWMREGNAIVQK